MSVLIEHLSDVRCASGSVSYGFVTPIVMGGRIEIRHDETGSFQCRIPETSSTAALIELLHVLRVREPSGEIREWRVRRVQSGSGPGRNVRSVTAYPIALDLGNVLVRPITGQQPFLNLGAAARTVTEIIDDIVLPALVVDGITWVSRGTVETTDVIDIEPGVRTPLSLMREIEKQTAFEFRLRRRTNDTGYEIDVLERIGSGATVVTLQVQRNLFGIDQDFGGESLSTEIVPIGLTPTDSDEPATMERAVWRIEAINGASIDIVPHRGGTLPVGRDGRFVGNYALREDGALVQITGSTAPKTIMLTSAGGFNVGDHIEIRKDSTGTLLIGIAEAGAVRPVTRTVEVSEGRGERNHVPNPAAAAGSHTTDVVSAQVVSTAANGSNTNVTLKNLPPSTTISAGDSYLGFGLGVRSVITGATSDGSGNATITIQGSYSATADSEVSVYRTGVLPTGWATSGFNIWQRAQIGAADISGFVNGSQSNVRRVLVSGLPPNVRIDAGDLITFGSQGPHFVTGSTIADGAGGANIEIVLGTPFGGERINVTHNDNVTITRPAPVTSDIGAFGPIAPIMRDGSPAQTPFRSPLYTVRHTAPQETLWFSAQIAYIGEQYQGVSPIVLDPALAPHNFTPARLELIDDTGALLESIDDVPRTLNVGVTIITLRKRYDLTATKRLALRVRPVLYGGVGTWRPVAPFTQILWTMIHIGPDPAPPVTDHSHGTELAQRAIDALELYGPETGQVIELEGYDLARDSGFITVDEELTIGGDVRLVQSNDLSDVRTSRLIGLRWDPAQPKSLQLILDTKPRELSRLLGGGVSGT